nr:glycine--tRNA ligase-like [Penaeus vannamei]
MTCLLALLIIMQWQYSATLFPPEVRIALLSHVHVPIVVAPKGAAYNKLECEVTVLRFKLGLFMRPNRKAWYQNAESRMTFADLTPWIRIVDCQDLKWATEAEFFLRLVLPFLLLVKDILRDLLHLSLIPIFQGMVANETLGYYMARIYQYLLKIGINPKKLRFRQHLSNEMAHYACDCWDAECLTSYGWIECVGCADRSAYDLGQHTKASGVRLSVERPLKEPRIVDAVAAVPDKGIIGKTFKKDAKAVQEALASLSNEVAEKMDKALSEAGEYELNGFKLTRAMVPSFKREQKKVHVEEYIPSVVEPSFGVGRVLYSLLEHSFRVREDDDKRTYFSLPPIVAPVKVSVLPLSNKPEFIPFTVQLSNDLTELNISSRIDDSTGSIGRRYARTDEIAIPFGVTIDFDTCNNTPNTVTLRERDSTEQVRMPVSINLNIARLLVSTICVSSFLLLLLLYIFYSVNNIT